MDVIVIGGGIAGCATAFYLAEDGVDVLLLERDDLNLKASGANAGSLHVQIQYEPFRDGGAEWTAQFLPALPFFAWSIALWQQAASEFGPELEVALDGGLIVAASDRDLRRIESKVGYEQRADIASELLDRDALLAKAPYLSEKLRGGAYCPIEGKANPLRAAPLFAAAAEARGAILRCGQRVTGLRAEPSGGYSVQTADAEYRAPRVVNAAGSDAGRIAAMLGRHLPLQAFPLQLAVTEPVTPLVRHLVYSAEDMLTLKQAKNGRILVGGGWPADVDARGRPQVSAESLSRNLAVALSTVPALAGVNVVRCWAAVVNGTDSWLPVLGELQGCPGFFMNYVPWMGFSGGPGGARIIASLMQGKEPPVDFDLSAFRPWQAGGISATGSC